MPPFAFLAVFLSTCPASGRGQSGAVERAPHDFDFRAIELGPRITALKHQLESGDTSALARFWQETARSGTPLIEPLPNSPGKTIITFVFRGDSKTRSVALLAPLANSPGLPHLPLRRLLETNVWQASWQIRDDLRFSYRFARAGANPQPTLTTDPFNPHKMKVSFEGANAPATEFSIAAAPRAPDERWIFRRPDVPVGLLWPYDFKSSVLRGKRRIWVYTPPGYAASTPSRYGLLILFDGFSYQHWIPAPAILDNLLEGRKIPPMVAVFIDNPPASRIPDLRYSTTFVNFVSDELLPWVRKHWNVTHDPQKTIMGGYSMGGAAAAFAAIKRPELFGNVLSQSGSF